MNIHADKILILDFGSQYTQLIARRVRELNVYCEIYSCKVDPDAIKAFRPKGIILSGGPETVTGYKTPRIPSVVFELGLPLLGICYGMQVMQQQLGGAVQSADKSEFGFAEIELQTACDIFLGVNSVNNIDDKPVLPVWMSHGDQVTRLADGFDVIARTENCPIAAVVNTEKKYYGLQFHPEVTHTLSGEQILSNFVHIICGCQSTWTSANIIDDIVESIRQKIGKDKVVLGLSGGVDSSVVAALLHKAIGDQLQCIFVDNGFLRQGEAKQVIETFSKVFQLNLQAIDATDQFYTALKGVADPEQKRKLAGKTFIKVFEKAALEHADAKWLAQGTIYPDVIESAAATTGTAHVIKSHHNVGGLPEDMPFNLIEPLRELFKDEVRKIGLALGLPRDLIFRHPFPGPGLAIRILAEVNPTYVEILQRCDAIYLEELRRANCYDRVSQAFAVFLPVKSVGVKGDARCYEYVIALRAVETIDFMTATWARLPYELLDKITLRILNEVSEVSRVVYDISGKPPATIEWE